VVRCLGRRIRMNCRFDIERNPFRVVVDIAWSCPGFPNFVGQPWAALRNSFGVAVIMMCSFRCSAFPGRAWKRVAREMGTRHRRPAGRATSVRPDQTEPAGVRETHPRRRLQEPGDAALDFSPKRVLAYGDLPALATGRTGSVCEVLHRQHVSHASQKMRIPQKLKREEEMPASQVCSNRLRRSASSHEHLPFGRTCE
jgi:hypothetical protein